MVEEILWVEFMPRLPAAEIEPGRYAAGTVHGMPVLVCNVDGVFHAVADRCSHAGLRLNGGILRGARLICPEHGAEFDVRSGKHLCAPAIRGIAYFTVRVSEDGFLELRQQRPWGSAPNPSS